MDSTTNPNPNPSQLSINPSTARKLPIKRKNPYSSTPSSNPNPNFTPKFDSTGDEPPPFKFHRIWTEPDEIRFLHGLLACSTEGLLFPRDLNVFYARFSGTMSQPYTKSQLSEKLRRLRKKFRVISSRLAKGLDKEILSPHDRSLYELSKQLWHPDYSDTSPFGNGYGKGSKFSLPNYTVVHELNDNDNDNTVVSNCVDNDDNDNDNNLENCVDNDDEEVKLREVNVEFEDGEELLVASGSGTGIGKIAAKAAIDVFDQSLKEVSISLVRQGLLNMENCGSASKEVKEDSIEKRWRQQCVAELDVLARRLRLVVEHSLQRG